MYRKYQRRNDRPQALSTENERGTTRGAENNNNKKGRNKKRYKSHCQVNKIRRRKKKKGRNALPRGNTRCKIYKSKKQAFNSTIPPGC